MPRFADQKDFKFLSENDHHVSHSELLKAIADHRIIVFEENSDIHGWLRYSLFWDNTPFMNMLYILDEYRGKGIGMSLVSFFEKEMTEAGYEICLTSTLSTENAQYFYRKLGYTDCGHLDLPGEPSELLFYKKLKK